MTPLLRSALLCALLLSTVSAAAAGSGTFLGTVIDSHSRQPVAGAQVTVASVEAQVEKTTVTDAHGNYRISQLPTGIYAVRAEGEGFKPFIRSGAHLRRPGRTIRVNLELLPATMDEVVETVGSPPTPDVSTVCMQIPMEDGYIKRIRYPVVRPPPPARKFEPGEVRVGDSRDRTPSWMLSRMPVLIANGTPQLVYRAPSAARGSPDFGN